MEEKDLVTQLCEKMEAEQDEFRMRLLSMKPSELLEHAYAYCTREDILVAVENGDMSEKEAQVLLKSETPLSDIYDVYVEIESDYMDVIRDAIRYRIEDVEKEEKNKNGKEER